MGILLEMWHVTVTQEQFPRCFHCVTRYLAKAKLQQLINRFPHLQQDSNISKRIPTSPKKFHLQQNLTCPTGSSHLQQDSHISNRISTSTMPCNWETEVNKADDDDDHIFESYASLAAVSVACIIFSLLAK